MPQAASAAATAADLMAAHQIEMADLPNGEAPAVEEMVTETAGPRTSQWQGVIAYAVAMPPVCGAAAVVLGLGFAR